MPGFMSPSSSAMSLAMNEPFGVQFVLQAAGHAVAAMLYELDGEKPNAATEALVVVVDPGFHPVFEPITFETLVILSHNATSGSEISRKPLSPLGKPEMRPVAWELSWIAGSVVAHVLDVPVKVCVPAPVGVVSVVRRTIWTSPVPAFEIMMPSVVAAGHDTGTVTSVAT